MENNLKSCCLDHLVPGNIPGGVNGERVHKQEDMLQGLSYLFTQVPCTFWVFSGSHASPLWCVKCHHVDPNSVEGWASSHSVHHALSSGLHSLTSQPAVQSPPRPSSSQELFLGKRNCHVQRGGFGFVQNMTLCFVSAPWAPCSLAIGFKH